VAVEGTLMGGMTEAELRAFGLTWLPEEARAHFDHMQVTHEASHDVRVIWEGVERTVCREDLCKQVRTVRFNTFAEYRDAITYGVRVEPDCIVVVDCTTDG
jgi:hypothetical protein